METDKKILTVALSLMIVALTCAIFYMVNDSITWQERVDSKVEKLREIAPEYKSTDNMTCAYLYRHSRSEVDWFAIFVDIEYKNEPWNNIRGYVWFNEETSEYHFEELE